MGSNCNSVVDKSRSDGPEMCREKLKGVLRAAPFHNEAFARRDFQNFGLCPPSLHRPGLESSFVPVGPDAPMACGVRGLNQASETGETAHRINGRLPFAKIRRRPRPPETLQVWVKLPLIYG